MVPCESVDELAMDITECPIAHDQDMVSRAGVLCHVANDILQGRRNQSPLAQRPHRFSETPAELWRLEQNGHVRGTQGFGETVFVDAHSPDAGGAAQEGGR